MSWLTPLYAVLATGGLLFTVYDLIDGVLDVRALEGYQDRAAKVAARAAVRRQAILIAVFAIKATIAVSAMVAADAAWLGSVIAYGLTFVTFLLFVEAVFTRLTRRALAGRTK